MKKYLLIIIVCSMVFPVMAQTDSVFFTISAGFEIWMKERLILYDKKNSEINEYTSLERGFLNARGVYPLISFNYQKKEPLSHTLGFNFMKKKNITNFDYGVDLPTIDDVQSYSAFYQFNYTIDKNNKLKLPFRLYVGGRLLFNYLKYSTIDYPPPIELFPNTTTSQSSYITLFQLIPGIRLKKKIDISVGLNINIAAWIWGNYHYTYENYSISVGKEYYEQKTNMNEMALAWDLYKEKLMINTFTFHVGYRFSVKRKISKQVNT